MIVDREGLQKKFVKDIKILLKKKKKDCDNIVVRSINIFLKIKQKGWLSIEKNYKYGKIKMLPK